MELNIGRRYKNLNSVNTTKQVMQGDTFKESASKLPNEGQLIFQLLLLFCL